MRNKKGSINKLTRRDTHDEHGKYGGLARAAMEVAEERRKQLDEIERLLDAGENDAAIVAMREYLGSKKKR